MNYDYEISLNLNDKIKIGNDVIIIVSKIHLNDVRLAFEAPRHISIIRQELGKYIRDYNFSGD